MDKLVINGGHKIEGELDIQGSKNAVLPILAATVLNGDISVIRNCPKLRDVHIMIRILRELGCKVDVFDDTVVVDSSTLHSQKIPDKLASEMRSSIIFLGPMLARCGKVTISYPGGCVSLLPLATM
ncbi:MAG TPA: UDP-N-acetylglucosamine 1-carboxyvinyltransferase [Clostridiaceae bacterium]|nr:UDP-N-acetylglucosamine 1-carboxyvinyltransferase [Clostridiaceae bacterium]